MNSLKGLALYFTVTLALASHAAPTIEVHGHRGARGVMPENTLPGFSEAMKTGVTALELDVVVSGDGILVVSHDPMLSPLFTRDRYGNWIDENPTPLNTLSLKQIKTFDVGELKPGTRYFTRFSKQRSVPDTQIPTLAEVFQLAETNGNKKIRFNIETKINPLSPSLTPSPDIFVDKLIAVIDRHEMRSRVVIQSFDWRTLTEVKRRAPTIRTSFLTAEQKWLDNIERGKIGASAWLGGLDIDDFKGSIPQTIKAASGDIWSPYFKDVSSNDIELAHSLGLSVLVWTVNDVQSMKAMIEMGVDGIITDYPDRLIELLGTLDIDVKL